MSHKIFFLNSLNTYTLQNVAVLELFIIHHLTFSNKKQLDCQILFRNNKVVTIFKD